jgi:hypothetical protein
MQCQRCGGPMMRETVIKLRRSLFGLRETRSQGAYCATCRIGVPIETLPVSPRPRTVSAAIARQILSIWLIWRYGGASWSTGSHAGTPLPRSPRV